MKQSPSPPKPFDIFLSLHFEEQEKSTIHSNISRDSTVYEASVYLLGIRQWEHNNRFPAFVKWGRETKYTQIKKNYFR